MENLVGDVGALLGNRTSRGDDPHKDTAGDGVRLIDRPGVPAFRSSASA